MTAAAVAGLLTIIVATAIAWSREQVKVNHGQIMTHSRVNRLSFSVPDEQATEAKRREARESAPRLYVLNESFLQRIEAALVGLPEAVENKASPAEIDREFVDRFALTPEALIELQRHVRAGSASDEWTQWVQSLLYEQLPAAPLIDSSEWGAFTTSLQPTWQAAGNSKLRVIRKDAAVDLSTEPAALERHIAELHRRSGLPAALRASVERVLLADVQPTFLPDAEGTARERERRAAAVAPMEVLHSRGEVIYSRGDRLSLQQYEQVRREAAEFKRTAGLAATWLPRAGTLGMIMLSAVLMAAYVAIFYPRIARNSWRVAALGGVMALMLGLTAFSTAMQPSLLYPAAVGPTIFVAIVVLLAYDQRMALFISAWHSLLTVMALEQGAGMFILLFAGCAVAILQLREVRNRNSLIRASCYTASALVIGAVMLGLLESPYVPGVWEQIGFNAVAAGAASFIVGFLVLGLLPSIEALFDITTGMTLAELRDPKHPLLRQLQQRAPGTYNHSLQVANIAEAAAEAIGANGLLVYVGAIYHDVGKLNKPEYFVENQVGSHNKHEKLSPAMSLLILVGHVKDGMELAREYNLPRALMHFIESHHGTTLVEFFYRAAQSRADQGDRPAVEEIEYRYPGPKPRSKEAAILMLADAVESATRTLAEPNPGRIEHLVRKLSRKRLNDGQFDRCDLTFRELGLIEDSIIKSLCAIYHGRIVYPSIAASGPVESIPEVERPPSSATA